MPNWVYCIMHVNGSDEELKRFEKFAKRDMHFHQSVLSAESFIPYPEGFKIMDIDDRNTFFNIGTKTGSVDGMDGGDWCRFNWGTKWDFGSAFLRKDEDGSLIYHFETAWSLPSPVFLKMSELFPKLTFDVSYDEESNDFNGDDTYKNGELIERVSREPEDDEDV